VEFSVCLCRPVYPQEEAEDENVVDDSGAAELTLDKIEDDAVLVIFIYFAHTLCKFFCVITAAFNLLPTSITELSLSPFCVCHHLATELISSACCICCINLAYLWQLFCNKGWTPYSQIELNWTELKECVALCHNVFFVFSRKKTWKKRNTFWVWMIWSVEVASSRWGPLATHPSLNLCWSQTKTPPNGSWKLSVCCLSCCRTRNDRKKQFVQTVLYE